ncbi:hypothetical protein [Macrococcoides caseolyticum]|uniref:hypothetical protein n=1 Tax=Macrococcoides caseolyticum TaxID=69966 RepID=UPI001642536F|nr:hypothetical protein [Macrococcus caseolyticus]
MATKSFTTDYKFNRKGAKKLIDAMESNKNENRPHVFASRIKDPDQILEFMKKIKK